MYETAVRKAKAKAEIVSDSYVHRNIIQYAHPSSQFYVSYPWYQSQIPRQLAIPFCSFSKPNPKAEQKDQRNDKKARHQ
jgi:hypothetical protein